jgi:glycosyltransferase involved in cell wall biosynthesis
VRVGIDLTCITTVFDGGKDQVIYNLLRGFRELGHERDLEVFCYDFLEARVRELLPGAGLRPFRRLRGKKLLQDLPLRTFALPREARARGLDVLLFPKYYTGLARFSIPTVVIPHDVQFRAFPERYSWLWRLRERALYGADMRLRDRIVAVSDFDAREIRGYYPRSAHKVLRIYNPIAFAPDPAPGEPRPHGRPYLLAINVAYPHKNTLTLLHAFQLVRDRIPHDLVLVGKIHLWNEYLRAFAKEQGMGSRVQFAGFVDEERMRSLLRHADLYVNPSLYEGFGMTPIEAMGAGVPTLTSRETALPETTLGLAQYYEPARDPAALAARIVEVLERPPSAADRAGIRAAVRARYDYRAVAREYWQLLEGLAAGEAGRADSRAVTAAGLAADGRR